MVDCPKCAERFEADFGMATCPGCKSMFVIDIDGQIQQDFQEESSEEVSAAPEETSDFSIEEPSSVYEETENSEYQVLHEEAEEQDVHEPEEETEEETDETLEEFSEGHFEVDVVSEESAEDEEESEQDDEYAAEEEEESYEGSEVEDVESEEAGEVEETSGNPYDLGEIADYGNSEVSLAKDGRYVYDVILSDIDSPETRELIEENLTDKRLGLNTKGLMKMIEGGRLTIQRVNAIKASIIVSRLKSLPLSIEWRQNAIDEMDMDT